jgi:hypothetical protein
MESDMGVLCKTKKRRGAVVIVHAHKIIFIIIISCSYYEWYSSGDWFGRVGFFKTRKYYDSFSL